LGADAFPHPGECTLTSILSQTHSFALTWRYRVLLSLRERIEVRAIFSGAKMQIICGYLRNLRI
jgi:hypothetical protein